LSDRVPVELDERVRQPSRANRRRRSILIVIPRHTVFGFR